MVLTREEALNILTDIAKGNTISEKGPTDGDRLRAIDRIAKMQGWDIDTKSEDELNDKAPKQVKIIFENFSEQKQE